MNMESSDNTSFNVKISNNNQNETVEITRKETSDGQPYYACDIDGSEVQLRKDEVWEVIWGEMSAEQAELIGAEIEKHIEKKP